MRMYDLEVFSSEDGTIIFEQVDGGEEIRIFIAQEQLQAVIDELQKLKK